MKHILAFFFVLFSAGLASGKSNPMPVMTPTPVPTPMTAIQAEPRRDSNVQSPLNQQSRFETKKGVYDRDNVRPRINFKKVDYLYRKPTKNESKLIEVDSSLVKEYKEFLRSKNTGIFRLVTDFGCTQNDKVTISNENCLKYSMPGNGAAYSFRVNNYRILRLADLSYRNNRLYSGGSYIQSAIANIGKQEIAILNSNSHGIKELSELSPERDLNRFSRVVERLKAGVIVNNIFFSDNAEIELDSTYIMRSIAFDIEKIVSVDGLTYNEFELDKRQDIIVAFQVVRRDADGSITIVWKEISRKKSPSFD
jgi:hypothetical protein